MGKKIVRLLSVLFIINAAFAILLLVLKRKIPSVGEPDSDEVALAAIADGVELKSEAMAFRGGSVLAIAGGANLDLREAVPDPEGIRLKLSAVMGGIEVLVPKGWRVDLVGKVVLGGVDKSVEPAEDLPDDAPEVSVEALAIMGGVVVSHGRPQDDQETLADDEAPDRDESAPSVAHGLPA